MSTVEILLAAILVGVMSLVVTQIMSILTKHMWETRSRLEKLKKLSSDTEDLKEQFKLGICGKHGGDPKSIEFCSKAGLNYVSCSPYRVPIARLAAAQAELKK